MILKAEYSTGGLFTLGEVRALIEQTAALPDEAEIQLLGQDRNSEDELGRRYTSGQDVIAINWEDA